MDLEKIGFDLYQMSIVTGIKLKALLSTLDEEQRKKYEDTINEEISKIKAKLETSLTQSQAASIIEELSQF